MNLLSNETLVEAVKRAESPKMALDGVKLLLGASDKYHFIFHETFELAWKDATRRNRSIEYNEGANRDEKWKDRLRVTNESLQFDAQNFAMTKSSKRKASILGKVLSEYDAASLKEFFDLITLTEA